MRRGDFAWVAFSFGRHPAIVWDASDLARVVVISGTSRARNIAHVCVQPFTRYGKALGLKNPTYFYATSVVVVDQRLICPPITPCPPGILLQLEALLQSLVPPKA